jgi:nitrous oxidase accessory protein
LLPAVSYSVNDTLTVNDDLKSYFADSVTADTVFISGGTYYVKDIRVTKRGISIIGLDKPKFDANKESEILIVEADSVLIQGITFSNTGVSFITDFAAVRIQNSSACRLIDNTVENSFFAIYLSNCSNTLVSGNRILGNSVSESFSGNGIHLWNCNKIFIFNNEICRQRDGIYLEFATNSIILGNNSYSNLRYGLHFMFSEGNKYVMNSFSQNGAGVAVMYTKRVSMIYNNFFDNWGSNSYGLLFKDIDNSTVAFNKFRRNTVGIYSEGSNRLLVSKNIFIDNGWAMKILGNCYDGVFNYNEFRNNTFDLATNSSRSNNTFNYNYWDKYKGYDLGKDGIGDVPYRPVNLFSVLIETSPDAMIILNSFVVDIIDFAEKVSPAFTPETLSDDKPLMKGFPYAN